MGRQRQFQSAPNQYGRVPGEAGASIHAEGVKHLELADIILSTTDHGISKSIRAATEGPVSYSMLWVGNGNVIESIAEGVVENALGTALQGATVAIVLRRRGLGSGKAAEVVEHARKFQVARLPYDELGAIGAGMTPSNTSRLCTVTAAGCMALVAGVARNATPERRDLRFFCSELVARSFQMAGMPLTDEEPTFTNPYEVLKSSYLKYVGNLPIGKEEKPPCHSNTSVWTRTTPLCC